MSAMSPADVAADAVLDAVEWMRKRAERVKSRRYGFSSQWTTPTTMLTRILGSDRVVAESRDAESLYDLENLSHWHPAVALAVADLLEVFTDAAEWPYCDCGDDACNYGPCLAQRRAVAVARAYIKATP